MKIITAISFLLFLSVSWSGSIDLSVEVNPSSISIIESVEIGEFSITLTNHGPDAAGSSSPISFPISIDTNIIYFEAGVPNAGFASNPDIIDDCLFFPYVLDPLPGNPVGIIYSFFTPVIPAGESVTCYGLYYTNFDNGIRTVEWSPSSVTDNDTDPSNDISLMTFRGFVAPVPSLTVYGIVLLALMFLGMGFRFSIKP